MNEIEEPPHLTPFLKQLASTGILILLLLLTIERPVREKAVESLRLFLSQSRQFTELDFLKLWKGLYYCMWMCDRMRVQQQLADTLGNLVSVLQTHNTILFIQAFWTILCKQWPTLDQHRYVFS
jgi:ribosomal RNA-processing protein 1